MHPTEPTDAPHRGTQNVRQWFGDSRRRWEGATRVDAGTVTKSPSTTGHIHQQADSGDSNQPLSGARVQEKAANEAHSASPSTQKDYRRSEGQKLNAASCDRRIRPTRRRATEPQRTRRLTRWPRRATRDPVSTRSASVECVSGLRGCIDFVGRETRPRAPTARSRCGAPCLSVSKTSKVLPQPYGELFMIRPDRTGLRQLTDNQWEDATPAWMPQAGA